MILTPDNIQIIGITQEPLTDDYYLVFYNDIHSVLDVTMQMAESAFGHGLSWLDLNDFEKIEEIQSHCKTVYIAKCKNPAKLQSTSNVVLKQFSNSDQMFKMLIFEVIFIK